MKNHPLYLQLWTFEVMNSAKSAEAEAKVRIILKVHSVRVKLSLVLIKVLHVVGATTMQTAQVNCLSF